jgi:hypothetical protein
MIYTRTEASYGSRDDPSVSKIAIAVILIGATLGIVGAVGASAEYFFFLGTALACIWAD